MNERDEAKQFDAEKLLTDLRNYKANTPEIPWVPADWIAKMEARFAAERAEEGLEDDD
jgi:hypothetical protein